MVDESITERSSLLSQLKIDREEEEKSGMSIPFVIFLLIVVLIIGMAGGWYFFSGNSANSQDSPPSINQVNNVGQENSVSEPMTTVTSNRQAVETPKPASLKAMSGNYSGESILDASGYITARRIATVSAELTGRITEVLVEEGMKVEEGQILAHLDDAIAQVNFNLARARMEAAQSQVTSATASYEEAKRVLARVSKLQSNDFSSEANLTSSTLKVETTRAELKRAMADVEVARLEVARQKEIVDDHTVKAPFSGIVTIKNAQPGEIVAPGSAGGGFTRTGICTIVDMTSLEIEADVNEAFIGRIFNDQQVRANLDAYPDWDIPASVIAIIPTANRDKATVRVRIRLDVADSRILPDMGVKIAFYGSQN